jgi:hypothetical protein
LFCPGHHTRRLRIRMLNFSKKDILFIENVNHLILILSFFSAVSTDLVYFTSVPKETLYPLYLQLCPTVSRSARLRFAILLMITDPSIAVQNPFWAFALFNIPLSANFEVGRYYSIVEILYEKD